MNKILLAGVMFTKSQRESDTVGGYGYASSSVEVNNLKTRIIVRMTHLKKKKNKKKRYLASPRRWDDVDKLFLQYRKDYPDVFNKNYSRTLISDVINHLRNNNN